MKEIRIAIIGTGMISHRHMTVIENLKKRGQALKVVAAAEIDKDKLLAFGKKYGIAEENLYQDFREMLKRDDIDEVEVCVHNNLHTSVATAVMAAGFDCYSEKPMAASYADAKILYDAQKKYGKKLAVQISSIYNPQTRIAKKMIEEGKLGKVYHARSVGHRRQGRPGYDMTLVFITLHRCSMSSVCRNLRVSTVCSLVTTGQTRESTRSLEEKLLLKISVSVWQDSRVAFAWIFTKTGLCIWMTLEQALLPVQTAA